MPSTLWTPNRATFLSDRDVHSEIALACLANPAVQAALARIRADAWDEGYGSDLTCETPHTNPYHRTPEGETK